MSVRSVTVLSLAVLLAGAASPALARPAAQAGAARGVDPLGVLAGRTARGFSDRTAGMVAIVGTAGVAPMRIPLRPVHPAGMRREADASARLR